MVSLSNHDKSRSLLRRLALILAMVAAAAPCRSVAKASPVLPPTFRQCELGRTQRVAFRIDNTPDNAGVGIRISLYDSKQDWIADEMFSGNVLDAPILPVAGYVDPKSVAKVGCALDGYISELDQLGFAELSSAGPGRKTCPVHGGLIVDGGPDAIAAAVVAGKTWMMVQFQIFINHFFTDQETSLTGDILAVSLDRGTVQKVVVSGDDPQNVSLLFTGLKPGLHEIDYGPWETHDFVTTGNGYHNICIRLI